MAARTASKQADAGQIRIPRGPRLGDLVIEAEHLSKGFGDRLLIDDLSFRLPPGGIVGVIGPNGAGKTTLFRMIIGQEKPDGGVLTVGDTVKLGYVDQSRDTLDADQHGLGGDLRRPRRDRTGQGARCRAAPMSPPSTSRAPTSRRRSASSRAASATACTWPRC